jgi:lipopolysaccharide assembly outer membrane protein LptD (OstA)
MRCRYIVLALILVFCLQAFSSAGLALEIPKKGEIHILADHLEYDQRAQQLKGQGNVQVNYEDLKFTSDEIDFSIPDGLLMAYGNVQISPDSHYHIQSDSLRFDTASRLFSVQNSRISLEPSYSFTASEIRQISPKEVIVTHASYTACDVESPAWRISCSGGTVELDRSAKLKNIILRVKDTPVFYFPYFWFPINQERATGFLTPDFGQSNKLGSYIQNYFYWPVRDWADFGFPLDYFEKKGIGTGLEYRYALTESDVGRIRAYGIYDKQQERGRGDLSLQLQQNFTSHIRGVADVTTISDDDYYQDFRQEISQRYSQSLESRAFVETNTDPWNGRILGNLTTFLEEGPNVHYSKAPEVDFYTRLRSFGHFPLFLQWDSSWANLQINDLNQQSLQAQKSLKAQRVDFSPRIFSSFTGRFLTLTPSLSYRKTCYYQQDEHDEQTRQDAQSGQDGQDAQSGQDGQDAQSGQDGQDAQSGQDGQDVQSGQDEQDKWKETTSRDLYGAGLDLVGPKFSRSFLDDRLDHVFYPRINLTYETMNQDGAGWFNGGADQSEGVQNQVYFGVDQLDRLEENRDITFSLINRVWEKETAGRQQCQDQSRESQGEAQEQRQGQGEMGGRGDEGMGRQGGREWMSLIISQKYGFHRDLPQYQTVQRQKGEAGFTDFEVEASSQPFHNFLKRETNQFDLKYRYDMDVGHTRLMDFQWSYGSSPSLFDLGWRYSRLDEADTEYVANGQDQSISLLRGDWQSTLSFYPLSSRWIGKVAFYYDLKNESVVENQYSVTYQRDCWSVQLSYLQSFDGQRWNIKIGLESLGGLGF